MFFHCRLVPFFLYSTLLLFSCRIAFPAHLLAASTPGQSAQAEHSDLSEYAETARLLIEAATDHHFAYHRLAHLSDYYPHRLSGSQMLEDAIDWVVDNMKKDGLPEVRTQSVKVPHWERGDEYARMIHPYEKNLPMLGFGGSVATPASGITASTVVVDSFEELEQRSNELKGKIVVFNQPFRSYGESVRYRVWGADRAATHGALAVLVRAVSPHSMGHPHTGGMRYSGEVPRIPAASISAEDAMLLRRFDQRRDSVTLTLYMEARMHPEMALSRNVIAEIPGSQYPEEIVVIGGHIDSWDVGHGAMDDAGGCVVTWEALRLIHQLGLRPRRTLRVVLWTNEENGVMGGRAYRDKVLEQDQLLSHQLAFEVDLGVFAPLGFGFEGSDEAFEMLKPVMSLLEPLGSLHLRRGAAGTVDIGPLQREGVPVMGLDVDIERYFWYHHSAKDTLDKLDPDEVARCVAAVAVMAYVVADMPMRLPWQNP